MKKLLLLLLTVLAFAFTGCRDKWQDVSPSSLLLNPTEEAKKLAKEFGINTTEIDINMSVSKRYEKDSIVTFTGRLNEKLWIGVYNCQTKSKINNSVSSEKFNLELKTFEPYVGEVTDNIKYFFIREMICEKNDYTFILDILTAKEKYYSSLIFSNNNVINSNFSVLLDYRTNIKKWCDNSILISHVIDEYNKIGCYSMEGKLIYDVKDNYAMMYIPTNNIYNGISIDLNIVKSINISTNISNWEKTINLNIPNNAKVIQNSNSMNENTLRILYDIISYDGTKTTKTVNIDVNTGEYTVL